MDARVSVTVQAADFDLAAEYARLASDASIGAIVQFVGRVRDRCDGSEVRKLTLEHYPGMTEKVLQDIGERVLERWNLHSVRIVHRVGPLDLADQIVLVQVASAHREAAFEAAQAAMDFLKTEAPFWKREATPEGSRWVDARAKDDRAATRWYRESAKRSPT
jgi:molybdopterin synthase catalytic subunit